MKNWDGCLADLMAGEQRWASLITEHALLCFSLATSIMVTSLDLKIGSTTYNPCIILGILEVMSTPHAVLCVFLSC